MAAAIISMVALFAEELQELVILMAKTSRLDQGRDWSAVCGIMIDAASRAGWKGASMPSVGADGLKLPSV